MGEALPELLPELEPRDKPGRFCQRCVTHQDHRQSKEHLQARVWSPELYEGHVDEDQQANADGHEGHERQYEVGSCADCR